MIHKKTSRNVKEILKPADDESEEYLFAGNTSPSRVKQDMRNNVKYGNCLFPCHAGDAKSVLQSASSFRYSRRCW